MLSKDLTKRMYVLLGVICVTLLTGRQVLGEAVLSPSSPDVPENSSLTLSCTYKGDEDITVLSWKRIRKTESAFVILGRINAFCNVSLQPVNTDLYRYDCPSSKQYLWTVKTIKRSNEGDRYQCMIETSSSGMINSNEVTISVKVPIVSVELISPTSSIVIVQEHISTDFKCKTSGGIPEATVTWHKTEGIPSQQGNEVNIYYLVTSSSENVNGLKVVTSTLIYTPSRNDNGWIIYCKAKNVVGLTHIVSTKKLQLNILYPPNDPKIKGFSDGEEFRIIENTKGQLSCAINGGNPPPTLAWDCFNSGTLIATDDDLVTNNLTWKAIRGQDKICHCRSFHNSGSKSVSINITVLYPPSIPTFKIEETNVNGTITVIKGNQMLVNCSSVANPPPSFAWIFNNSGKPGQMLSISNLQSGDRFTCTVENTMNPTTGKTVSGSISSYFDVQVLYAPSTPTFHYLNTSGQSIQTRSLDVIKDDTFKVACLSNGEPSQEIYWDNYGNNNILTITRIDTDKTSSICKATNTMKETVGQTLTKSVKASLIINVQYPPSTVTLTHRNAILTSVLKVREGSSFKVTCSSNGNPPPSYNWSGQVFSSSAELKVFKAVRSHAGRTTCYAVNVMIRTFANPDIRKIGGISKHLDLQVLYPPTIGDLQNISVVEGSLLNVSCPVTVGIPPQITYEWLKEGYVWKTGRYLTISSATRTDAELYTCKVSNHMEATGEEPVTSDVKKSFYLNVMYGAKVKEFNIVGHEGKSTVVRNENERVIFTCKVDSNPGSNMSVTYRDEILETKSKVKQLSHIISSSTCTLNGEYKCTGLNQYNKDFSYQTIHLYINCSPRPSPLSYVRQNVTSAQNIPAVLTFNALAYPLEHLEFKWYMWNNNLWQEISNGKEYKIETLNLQSNLTINYVNRTYYGRYQLRIKNTIGNYSQLFNLKPEDIPETPLDFQHSCEQLTESTITVQWKPGLDNGPRQTFLLRYKKRSDKKWREKEIEDSREKTMNFTVTSLSSGTQYQFVLYARNKIGHSGPTNILRIKTEKSSECEQYCRSNERTSEIIVGCVLGIIIMILTVYAGYITLLFRRTTVNKEQNEISFASRTINANAPYSGIQSPDQEGRATQNNMYPSSSTDDTVYMELNDQLKEYIEPYDVIENRH